MDPVSGKGTWGGGRGRGGEDGRIKERKGRLRILLNREEGYEKYSEARVKEALK